MLFVIVLKAVAHVLYINSRPSFYKVTQTYKKKSFDRQHKELYEMIIILFKAFSAYYWATNVKEQRLVRFSTGELGYDGPLYNEFLHMTDDMLGPSPMHIKYSSYVYDGFCIWLTNFPGPIWVRQIQVHLYRGIKHLLNPTWDLTRDFSLPSLRPAL